MKIQLITFCISNGRESSKYQGLQPAKTVLRFDMKVLRSLPLLIQFAVSHQFKIDNRDIFN